MYPLNKRIDEFFYAYFFAVSIPQRINPSPTPPSVPTDTLSKNKPVAIPMRIHPTKT